MIDVNKNSYERFVNQLLHSENHRKTVYVLVLVGTLQQILYFCLFTFPYAPLHSRTLRDGSTTTGHWMLASQAGKHQLESKTGSITRSCWIDTLVKITHSLMNTVQRREQFKKTASLNLTMHSPTRAVAHISETIAIATSHRSGFHIARVRERLF